MLNTLVSGMSTLMRDMERVFKFGQMDLFMRVTGKEIWQTDAED